MAEHTGRLDAARSLAWALLLGGWIGLGAMADRLASGPVVAFGLIAAWLFALGALATLVARVQLDAWLLRALLIAGAAVAARGLLLAPAGGGVGALLPALLAWALLTALASTTVRALRAGLPRRAGPPTASAAAGAFIAWAVVGDAGDVVALAPRLAGLLALGSIGLCLLAPSGACTRARPGCRAGLFDCSLPAWPAGAWRSAARWPVLLASLAMLPMMCSLPQMLALCRTESVAPQAVLGLHLAAMFAPALLWRGGRGTATATACGVLLALGGGAAWLAGPAAWWWIALLHGSAWSLAWSARLADPALHPAAHSAPWRAAAGHALFALLLGAAVALAGIGSVLALQLGLAAAALLALVARMAGAQVPITPPSRRRITTVAERGRPPLA